MPSVQLSLSLYLSYKAIKTKVLSAIDSMDLSIPPGVSSYLTLLKLFFFPSCVLVCLKIRALVCEMEASLTSILGK